MSNEIKMSVNELHQLAHMISSIVNDLDMEVSGVRYDGGVIGFNHGYGNEPHVVINRDLDAIAYDDECVVGSALRSLYGIGLIHDIDVITMDGLNDR